MKKIVVLSGIVTSLLMGASDPSITYPYEVSLFGTGTLKDNGLEKNYFNAGASVAKNFDRSFISQVQLSFMRSDGVDYKNSNEAVNVNRTALDVVKRFDISKKAAVYGFVGAGYQSSDNEKKNVNEDSALLNYGVGVRYDIPYYGIAIKGDVKHQYTIEDKDNVILYTVGLAMPLGKRYQNLKVVVNKVQEVKDLPNDDDNDGVINSLDKCPNTSPGVKVNEDGCVDTVTLDIKFKVDSAKINYSYMQDLERFATMLNESPRLTALIEAHTDSTGSNEYNQRLSERRAASAVNALKQLDVDPSRLESRGYGETQPIASNDTAEGRAENRRVVAYTNK